MNKYFLENNEIYFKKLDEVELSNEYLEWMNDPLVNKYMETRFFPHSSKDIEKYVNSISEDQNSVSFAIYDKKLNKHIGNIKLGPINWIHRNADISLFIGDNNYWGKGYASKSIELITTYGFDVLNLHKLNAGAYIDNIGSKKAFEKNGYIVEGIKKENCYINKKWTDIFLLGKINDN